MLQEAQGKVFRQDDAAAARLCALYEQAADIIEKEHGGQIQKPKEVTSLFRNIVTMSGQQQKGDCMFCGTSKRSTGATKFVDHLAFDCHLAPAFVQEPCAALRAVTAGKRKSKAALAGVTQDEADLKRAVVKDQQQNLQQAGVKAGFKKAEIVIADEAIGDFFFANAIPFGAADLAADSYFREMVKAIRKTPETYVPPGPSKLGGSLLEQCYKRMQEKIQARDADGERRRRFGLTYAQDGWDSVDKLPLINSAYITENDGGVYLRSVDTSGVTKDAQYIASLMIVDIYSLGCTNVVLIVTDTCNTMKAAWEICRKEFPWLLVLPCQAHVASLLAKDIGKIDSVKQTIKQEGIVVGWCCTARPPPPSPTPRPARVYGHREVVTAPAPAPHTVERVLLPRHRGACPPADTAQPLARHVVGGGGARPGAEKSCRCRTYRRIHR